MYLDIFMMTKREWKISRSSNHFHDSACGGHDGNVDRWRMGNEGSPDVHGSKANMFPNGILPPII
jgi:hypothetical protein